MTMVATELKYKTSKSSVSSAPKGGSNLRSAEDLFRVGDFKQCAKICKLYLTSKVSFYGLQSNRPEIQFDAQPPSIAEGHLICALFVQSVFESDSRELEADVSLIDRYLVSSSPVPFTLGYLWLSLKVELRQTKEVKELLEGYLAACANIVNGGKYPSTQLKQQYTDLVELYTVRVLPSLGLVDQARQLLDVTNTNTLLDNTQKALLLRTIESKISESQRAVGVSSHSGSQGGDSSGPNSPTSSAGNIDPDMLNNTESRTKSSTNTKSSTTSEPITSSPLSDSNGVASVRQEAQRNYESKKKRGKCRKYSAGPMEGVTWEEVGAAAACTVAVTILVSQRRRIRGLLSGIGDMVFGP